jgi:hypothetical protein
MSRPGSTAVNGVAPTSVIVPIMEYLRPLVAERFANDSPATQPRQALALKVGEFVSGELERTDSSLNLLERRTLISELINGLLTDASEARRDPAPVSTPPL